MNRKILFRAKIAGTNNWINGLPYSVYSENEIDSIQDIVNRKVEYINTDTLCQFTGLTDKNGTDIFEGDILSIKEIWNTAMDLSYDERDLFEINDLKGDLHDEYITDVIYEPGCFVIKTGKEDYDCFASVLEGNQKHSQPIFDCEIIGNTHDNPELLNTFF